MASYSRPHRARAVASIGLALCAAGAPGCYERVVDARGMGASGVKVEEPYRSETALDKAWDGALGDEPKRRIEPPPREMPQYSNAPPNPK